MKKNDKKMLVEKYKSLFSLYQDVAMSNFFYGMSISSTEEHEKRKKAEDAFIKAFVEIECMLDNI